MNQLRIFKTALIFSKRFFLFLLLITEEAMTLKQKAVNAQ